MKKIAQVLFVLLLIAGGCFLAGCSHSTIQFYRESEADHLIKDLKNQDNAQNRPQGVIKLDNSSQSSGGIQFGPGEINFGR